MLGGRAHLRSLLYMSVVAGIRCNPTIRGFYKHLLAAGKAPKIAIVACMRKLLVILNAMLKSQKRWRINDRCEAPAAAALGLGQEPTLEHL